MSDKSDDTIVIATDERVFLAGRTKSGKTFAARELLAKIPRLVVCDPKASDSIERWRLAPWDRESQRLLRNGEPVRTRVKRDPTQREDEFWDEVLFECWNAGNVVVYIDEVYLLKPESGGYPRYLSLLYTTGRERGIGTWASAQRPTFIPMVLMSEAEHVFAFRLLREDDRSTLAKNTHPVLEQQIPPEDKHGFFYWNIDQDTPLYYPSLDSGHGEGWGDLGDLEPEPELEEETA